MNRLTPEQVKGRIKNVAQNNHADPRVLMRFYMMERFLERVANSKYRDNFIIKGGILVTAIVGVGFRSTMDIDTTLRNQTLSREEAERIINEIKNIDLEDGVKFKILEISDIMEGMEYPGIRFNMNAVMGNMITPLKIDISTGDVITPRAIEYQYKLLLEDRTVRLLSYNLETILAEKLQTILARGSLNTRMRDFYDIYILLSLYNKEISQEVLKNAFCATCHQRGTGSLLNVGRQVVEKLERDKDVENRWDIYRRKYSYATEIQYVDVIESVRNLLNKIGLLP